jgi:transketolase N-terminal domain/subunit
MNDKSIMQKAADNIRILSAAMVEKANSGHPGGAMGGADFINVLFSEFLEYDPENPHWEHRDPFFLDPGHMSPMLYSLLALSGKFTLDELKNSGNGQSYSGHPEIDVERGIENTSGPWDKVMLLRPEQLLPPNFLRHGWETSSIIRFTPTSRMAAFRKKYRKAWDALPVI